MFLPFRLNLDVRGPMISMNIKLEVAEGGICFNA
jgi:hypothetical protein